MARFYWALWELVDSVAPYLDGRFKLDMDQVIEGEEESACPRADFCKKKVKQPFARWVGTFRRLAKKGDDVIISTGGSVVVTERNCQLLAKKSLAWLHASFDVVYDQLKRIPESAPTLSQ